MPNAGLYHFIRNLAVVVRRWKHVSWRILCNKDFPLEEIVMGGIIISFFVLATEGAVFRSGEKAESKMNYNRMIRLNMALQTYRWSNNIFPDDLGALACQGQEKNSCIPVATKELLLDVWGTPYIYRNSGDAFTLESLGADKQPGGRGTNADISFTGP